MSDPMKEVKFLQFETPRKVLLKLRYLEAMELAKHYMDDAVANMTRGGDA